MTKTTALLASAAALAFAAPANAATIIVDFTLGSDGSGQFRYDAGETGVINFADLLAFNVSFTGTGNSYDLTFAQTQAHQYLGFDTNTQRFVAAPFGPFNAFSDTLTATNTTGTNRTTGFGNTFFFGTGPYAGDYAAPGILPGPLPTTSGAVVTAVSAIPEPAVWGLMVIGFGAVGAMVRRKGRRRVSVAYA